MGSFKRQKSLRGCPLVPPAPLIIKSSVDMTPSVMDAFRRYLLRVCYDRVAFEEALNSGQVKFDKSSPEHRDSIGSMRSESVSLRIPHQRQLSQTGDRSPVA